MNTTHPKGRRLARRAAQAGWFRSPKGGVGWRRKQWIWGMTHHPRHLDRLCFKITGGRYLAELAEATPEWTKAQKALAGDAKQSKLRRALNKLGF